MKYFYDCIDEKQAKEKYRKLSKELHPDKGGSHEKMIDLQQQYDKFLKEINNTNEFRKIYEENYCGKDYSQYESYDFGYKRYEPKYRSPSYEYEKEEIKKLNTTIQILRESLSLERILVMNKQIEIDDLTQTINSLKIINAGFPLKLDEKDQEIKELEKKVKTYKNFNLYLSGLLVFMSILKLIFNLLV
jgi:curved DNA-binding protein CbpA